MEKLVICYHGTTKDNAKNILKNGFNKTTFFAKNLQDALAYGGEYIFEICFVVSRLPNDWQFKVYKKVSQKKIVGHYRLTNKVLYDNDKLRQKIFNSNA